MEEFYYNEMIIVSREEKNLKKIHRWERILRINESIAIGIWTEEVMSKMGKVFKYFTQKLCLGMKQKKESPVETAFIFQKTRNRDFILKS